MVKENGSWYQPTLNTEFKPKKLNAIESLISQI